MSTYVYAYFCEHILHHKKLLEFSFLMKVILKSFGNELNLRCRYLWFQFITSEIYNDSKEQKHREIEHRVGS